MSDGVGCGTKSHAKARRREEEWVFGFFPLPSAAPVSLAAASARAETSGWERAESAPSSQPQAGSWHRP
jgi:hypothetical protein